MDNNQEFSEVDTSIPHRKFGLPGWMVNNIERLNFATDFEQYACSPPETEGFLSDYKEGQDMPQMSEPFCPIVEPAAVPDLKIKNVIPVNTDSVNHPTAMPMNTTELTTLRHTLLTSIKSEEFCSSPDTTPCGTPQPSPVVRRKMSNPSDTVISNPGRWFYLGKVNKLQKSIKEISPDMKNKENKIKIEDKCLVHNVKPKESLINSKTDSIKIRISNFDLNAVSPNSW